MMAKSPTTFVTAAGARECLGVDSHGLRRRVARGWLTEYLDPLDLRVRLFDAAEVEALKAPRPMMAPPREGAAVA